MNKNNKKFLDNVKNNELFLSAFDDLKKNPEHYKKDNSEIILWASIFSFSLTFFITVTMGHKFSLLFWIIACIYAGSNILTMIFCFFYGNKKRKEIEKLVFRGKLSDLFQDINHKAIISRKNMILEEYQKFDGIRGHLVLDIFEDIYSDLSIREDSRINEILNIK